MMRGWIAQRVYQGYVDGLRGGGARSRVRRWRRIRRHLLRFIDPLVVVDVDGFRFMTPFSSGILLSHFEHPLYDTVLPRLAGVVRRLEGRLDMVDVGANVGASTFLVSRENAGRFLCVEANPFFRPCLEFNLRQIRGAEARLVALAEAPQTARVRYLYAEGNSCIRQDEQGIELAVSTLDREAGAWLPESRPNLVKVDTEGFELRILRGARETLGARRPALFFEFYPNFIRREGGAPDDVFSLLTGLGYARFLFYDGEGYLLLAVEGSGRQALGGLRRYCELRHAFYDVVALPAGELSEEFLAREKEFFDRQTEQEGRVV